MMRICGIFRLSVPVDAALVAAPLTIDGTEPKFFIEALRKSVQCQRLHSETDMELWALSFFTDTRFASQFIVAQREVNEGEDLKRGNSLLFEALCQQLKLDRHAPNLVDSGRLCFIAEVFSDAALVPASLYLRGSKALVAGDFKERRGRHLAIEARGLAMISANASLLPMFQRYAVLLSLLRAYQYAIDLALASLADLAALAESIDANEALSSLRRDTLVFSARFLFLRPVRLDTVDLRYVWEDLALENHLSNSHTELTEQLNAVHALVQFDHDKREDQRERRMQMWLAWIGILLAAVALLEVTPAKLKDFFAAWMS
jgi:hypothetical protein